MNDYIINFLKEIMAIDSPSGYTKEVIHHCQKEAENLGFHTHQTNKGNLEIYVEDQDDNTVVFCSHMEDEILTMWICGSCKELMRWKRKVRVLKKYLRKQVGSVELITYGNMKLMILK